LAPLDYRSLLQKSLILSSLLIVATPYVYVQLIGQNICTADREIYIRAVERGGIYIYVQLIGSEGHTYMNS